jgi:hypothetical protein
MKRGVCSVWEHSGARMDFWSHIAEYWRVSKAGVFAGV